MKRQLLAFAFILAACTGTGFAQTPVPYAGIYGFGIELDGTGAGATNSGQLTMYAVSDNSDLALSSPTPNLDSTDWTSASLGSSPTFNLGTFTQGVSTLTLTGGAMDTFKGNGADVTGTNLNYSIGAVSTNSTNGADAGTYTFVNLPYGADLTFNDPPADTYAHNQVWDTQSQSINLLAGLTPGTYELAVYGQELNTVGNAYANNGGGGANYGATFTVVAEAVPEPSTWAMMLGGLATLVCFQIIRRKSAV